MALLITISAILTIIVGIVIMVWPKIINYAIGIWFITYGILQLMTDYNFGI